METPPVTITKKSRSKNLQIRNYAKEYHELRVKYLTEEHNLRMKILETELMSKDMELKIKMEEKENILEKLDALYDKYTPKL